MDPTKNCLGIVRETFNVWERRAPLTPEHVKRLTDQGIKVLIQPSDSRVFPVEAYEEAGAEVREDLSEASVIVGVKQVPPAELIPYRVYSFFSHTIKAQPDNMPLLDTILEKNVQLVDYEMFMINDQGDRVGFGKWAGRVGVLDILHGLGLRLVALGFNTPFLYVGMAHNYRNMIEVETSMKSIYQDIVNQRLPRGLCPMVIVVTGYGRVSKGAQEVLNMLPHEYVTVDSLPELFVNDKPAQNKIYICVVSEGDHLKRKDGGAFSMDDYLKNPHAYCSVFASKVAPYASMIINCIVWLPGHPRMLTNEDAARILASNQLSVSIPGKARVPHRLLAVSDISADPGGSLEFVHFCTTIDKPFFIHRGNPSSDTDRFDVPDGVLVCSVDNMPSQMAGAAASDFSDMFVSSIPDLLKADARVSFGNQDLNPRIRDATMTSGGKLTPKFQYIAELRQQKGV